MDVEVWKVPLWSTIEVLSVHAKWKAQRHL